MARRASSSSSTVRGTRRPGADRTSGARLTSRRRASSTAVGSASRSRRRRQREMAVGQGDDPVAVRQAQGPPVGAITPFLDPGDGGGGEMAEEVVRPQWAAEGQANRHAPLRGRPGEMAHPGGRAAGGQTAQLRRRQGEDVADGVVELADTRESGRRRHLAERQRGGFDEQAGGLGPLGPGQGQGAGAELGRQCPLDLPAAVVELSGQTGHTLPVHEPVGDQPHGPGHQVGALIPLGRARGGVGAAPLAGPEAALLRGGRARVEAHVLGLGRHHGATRTAVDPGGDDGREEPPVEAGILRLHGPYASLDVGVHNPIIDPGRRPA
jgi:hypothetical protein